MISLLDLVHSPIKLNPSFYSSNIISPNINTYHDYFQKKIKQTKPQRLSTSKHKKSRISVDQQSAISKDLLSRAKSSQNRSRNELKKKVKKSYKHYQINQMYLSRVSQMASEISIPTFQPKVHRGDLDKLENRIMSEILSLREEKINALSGLNSVMDRKNKAVEILRKLQMMRYAQRMNAQDGQIIEEERENDEYMRSKSPYADMQEIMRSPTNNKRGVSSNSRLSSAYNYDNNINGYQFSRRSVQQQQQHSIRSPSSQHQRPVQIINSKLSQQVMEIGDTFNQVNKIKQQLMKPLLNQHPLLIKNAQLKHQLQQLKQQLSSILSSPKPNIEEQINHYNQQNTQFKRQIQRQKLKLSSLQTKRFQTFFPKDKQKIDQVRNLIELERKLQQKKYQLQNELNNNENNGGIVNRKREDQLIIEQLKEENRQLMAGCERLLAVNGINEMNVRDRQYSSFQYRMYNEMALQQLQELVYRQQQNKSILQGMLSQFRIKISNLQVQNQSLKNRRYTNKSNYYYY